MYSAFTPLILIYLFIMDIFYIINSCVIELVVFLVYAITFGNIKGEGVEKYIDLFFEKVFMLSKVQVIGFRKLRTVSQFSLESIPQIVIQTLILLQMKS